MSTLLAVLTVAVLFVVFGFAHSGTSARSCDGACGGPGAGCDACGRGPGPRELR